MRNTVIDNFKCVYVLKTSVQFKQYLKRAKDVKVLATGSVKSLEIPKQMQNFD